MKFPAHFFVSLVLATSAAFAGAQASAYVSASSGSIAAQGSAGTWTGLQGSAARATISYQYGDTNTPPSSKFIESSSGGLQGQDLFYGTETPGGSLTSLGQSTVTAGAINYYTVDWALTTDSSDSSAATQDGGTFDPFDVRYGDVSGLAGATGGPVDVYFQSALRANGGFGQTSAFANPGSFAGYNYSLSLEDPLGNRTNILSIDFSTTTGLNIDFNSLSGVQVYLLDPSNADLATVTPGDRIAAGTPILSPTQTSLIASQINSDGTLNGDLSFGLLRTVNLLPGGNADDRLFTWHVDTTVRLGPAGAPTVPGPMAAVPFALLALRRRRNRA